MELIRKMTLPMVVFITGACVLVIEVVATRILSPYYGNTIFTVSSVLGIVLAALSFGYYIGGRLADKYPTEKFFYSLIFGSGLTVVMLHLLALILLPIFGYNFSMVSGPIVFSLILFFIPGFILGMLSPFAMKLQVAKFPNQGLGSAAGEMFFWSTLGSICGSLMTGFVFIPYFGINRIIIGVSLVLLCLGAFPLIRLGIKKKSLISFGFLGIAGLGVVTFLTGFEDPKLLYSSDGIYEKISIYNSESNGRAVRIFKQDHSTSGAMYIDTGESAVDYTSYYSIHPVFTPQVRNALVIGGGAYLIPNALVRDLPEVQVDVSEIEPSLYELAQKYFNVQKTDRIRNSTDDGRRFLRDADKQYDLIFSDVYYSFYSIPSHFTTQEFFAVAKNKLADRGIFVANLIGDLSRQRPSLLMSEIKTFRTIFPNSYFFAVESPAEHGAQNIIFVGFNSDIKVDFNAPEIANHANPVIASLRHHLIDLNRYDFIEDILLTDNYAPTEHLTMQVLERKGSNKGLVNGEEMLAIIQQQVGYGPRHLTAPGHARVQDFIKSEMSALGYEMSSQDFTHIGADGKTYALSNIITRFEPTNNQRIIIGSHYDSKRLADRDPRTKDMPVPGANDSASGVAVMLELARVLRHSPVGPNVGIDFVFFDGEEGEESQSSDYSKWKPLGSNYFVTKLSELYPDGLPRSGVVLDMVCDKDLKIFKEPSSLRTAGEPLELFWNIAKSLHPNIFRDNQMWPSIMDDHSSLTKAGIPSFLLIDFDYPPFHTTADTVDKCSAQSLSSVASALWQYLLTLK
jgi:predicted membrane-bound spermidine synthase